MIATMEITVIDVSFVVLLDLLMRTIVLNALCWKRTEMDARRSSTWDKLVLICFSRGKNLVFKVVDYLDFFLGLEVFFALFSSSCFSVFSTSDFSITFSPTFETSIRSEVKLCGTNSLIAGS
eukprot:GDKK01057178.1.p1 GENE.GDKK01057178.1~~GDKK01057178.1.p1  ORF type:complete len:122 (-),score=16.27 GDKK01057178.1:294-659(-)